MGDQILYCYAYKVKTHIQCFLNRAAAIFFLSYDRLNIKLSQQSLFEQNPLIDVIDFRPPFVWGYNTF